MTFQEITTQAEELFGLVMSMYQNHLEALETLVNQLNPETDGALLEAIEDHAKEVESAMEHDVGLFIKALGKDRERMKSHQEAEDIQAIYKQLNLRPA